MNLYRLAVLAVPVAVVLPLLTTPAPAVSRPSVTASPRGGLNPGAYGAGNFFGKFDAVLTDPLHSLTMRAIGEPTRASITEDGGIPAAKRTFKVSALSALETRIRSAEPGDHLVVADGVYTTR